MQNKATVTCGCGAVQTASVFRAVEPCAPCVSNGTDWNHWDRNVRQHTHGCTCGKCESCTGNTANSRNCGCNTCESCCTNSANTHGCTCGKCESCTGNAVNSRNCGLSTCETCTSCAANSRTHGLSTCATPAMVYETEHCMCDLHAQEEAIRKGTLFSDLYMPMNGECADNSGAQLCPGQAEAFAAWELRLYLNTHPHDRQALELFKRYAYCADQPNYAGAFAFDDDYPDRWSWTDAPWPWEFNAACENGCGCCR